MTELIYMNDFGIIECIAEVLYVNHTDEGVDIQLNKTCFYPKGGGQDYDIGEIIGEAGKLKVEKVFLDEDGVVHHYGMIDGSLMAGEEVRCEVERERRELNTRLHSGGHILDMAIDSLGYEWEPGRGAHYPDMSFVEYSGEADMENKEQIISDIEYEIEKIQGEGIVNSIKLMDRTELSKYCRHVPDYIPENKPTRVVMYGDFGVPCGGTHVKELNDIGKVKIRKLKRKDGKIRVSYQID